MASAGTEMIIGFLAQGEGAPPAEEELTFLQRMLGNPFVLPVGLFMLFYFLVLAPERRRKAEEANLMNSLKKNDRVVTVGGIHGTVVSTSADAGIVTIRIDEQSNTRIKVNRTAISKIVSDEKENKSTSSKETATETKDS